MKRCGGETSEFVSTTREMLIRYISTIPTQSKEGVALPLVAAAKESLLTRANNLLLPFAVLDTLIDGLGTPPLPLCL